MVVEIALPIFLLILLGALAWEAVMLHDREEQRRPRDPGWWPFDWKNVEDCGDLPHERVDRE